MKYAWDKVLLFAFSICLIVGLISIALLKPIMTEQQWFICIWALAFGGAGFAAFLPGSIEWQLKPGLKATGAFAVLLLVFWFGKGVQSEHAGIKEWLLAPPSVDKGPGPDISNAAVYVYRDEAMVRKFNASPPPWLKIDKNDNKIKIERGHGGIRIKISDAEVGSKLFFVVQDGNQWWISDELTVPPPFNTQLEPTVEATVRKRVAP